MYVTRKGQKCVNVKGCIIIVCNHRISDRLRCVLSTINIIYLLTNNTIIIL